jgi:hypothetical protein
MLEYIDMFGYQPQLLIHGMKSGKTKLGGSLVLLLIFFMISLISYYCTILYQKDNPTVLVSETYDRVMPAIALTDNNFTFPFALEDNLFNPLTDPSYYTINSSVVRIVQNEKGQQWINTPLNFSRCSNTKGQMIDTGISEDFLNRLYCADYDRNTYINSSYEFGDYTSLQFEFFPCRNGSNVICKPTTEIERLLNNTILLGQYMDYVILPTDYDKPVHKKIGNWFTSASMNYFKQVEVFIKQLVIQTDMGLVFTNIDEKEYLQVDEIKELFYLQPSSDDLFLRLIFRYSSTKTIYFRRYIKLQNVFIELGGFLKFLQVVVVVLSYLYSKLTVYEKIHDIIRSKAMLSPMVNHSEIVKFNSLPVVLYNKQFDQASKNKTVKISFFEYARHNLCQSCKLSNRSPIIQQFENEVHKYLDLNYVIPQLVKIERLESIVNERLGFESLEGNIGSHSHIEVNNNVSLKDLLTIKRVDK